MVERLLCKQGVSGSSPLTSTTRVEVRGSSGDAVGEKFAKMNGTGQGLTRSLTTE